MRLWHPLGAAFLITNESIESRRLCESIVQNRPNAVREEMLDSIQSVPIDQSIMRTEQNKSTNPRGARKNSFVAQSMHETSSRNIRPVMLISAQKCSFHILEGSLFAF